MPEKDQEKRVEVDCNFNNNLNMPKKIYISHILVKYVGSRRPRSWRCSKIELSEQEAINKLSEIRQKILMGLSSFSAIAREESDCSSAANGGDLGLFKPGKFLKEFEDVVTKLKIGEISKIFKTKSGFHIAQIRE